MTSPTIDLDDIELIKSTPTRMDSLDADISDAEWKEFANHMQIFEHERIQQLEKSYKPKFLRRFFSSVKAIPNLHQAAKLGKTDMMKVLLELGRTDVNKIDKAGQTALHYAVREGHLEIVIMLLAKRNIDASLRDRQGNTALHNAAKHGHVLIFEMILKAQEMDVNNINNFGETVLILAAGRGHKEIVDMLLKVPNVVVTSEDHKSTPLHAATEYKTTPLHAAAKHGHAVIAKMILPRMDVNSIHCTYKQSPLHLAIQGGHETMVDLLLRAPTVDHSLKDSKSNTPLHYAAKAGNEVIFEKLLRMPGVDVNSPNEKGMTALHLAAKYKHANIVTMLLEVPIVDPCAKTEKDKTPLHMAAKFGGVDVVQVLLATRMVDVNITDSKKCTAIHWAIYLGHLNVVEFLLKVQNVSPCLGDDDDNTPLHLAAKLGHQGIVERLILEVPHLDLNKVNKQNETPLFLAARHGSVNVVDFLLENPKVDLSICDHHGDSPFHAAIKGGHANIAKKLITLPRAVPIHSNKENMMALHLCVRGGHENLVDILLKQSFVDASAKDAFGNFPIHYAAQNGNTRIFQKILNTPGVDVNSVNGNLDTALHLAMRMGHVDVIDLLLQVPTLNACMRDWDGNSALHVAAKYGEEEIIEKLLKAVGVDVNAENEDGVTALVLAAEEGHVHVVDKLLEVPDVLNNEGVRSAKEDQGESSKKDWGIRSLILAARNGHNTIIKSLLAHDVDVNGTFGLFGPALSEAIQFGHLEAVEVLLDSPNIDPNRRNLFGAHPLFIAVEGGQKAIIQKLKATTIIDVNALFRGETALQRAARAGREQVVMILLDTPGIDVHIRNGEGETALFYAARANNKTILKYIYSASKVNVASEKHIFQTQLNINDKNDDGDSIIHLAARKNLLNVIDFLLEVVHDDARSVDVNLKTSPPKGKEDGFIPQSALHIAFDLRYYEVIQKLTKFDNVGFAQEIDGVSIFQRIFDEQLWQIFTMIKKSEEVTDYIDGLYKDRQASVDATNAILVGAALIASVTFASWLQPPLGYATFYHEQFSDSLPAPPVAYPEYVAVDHHPSLQAFWVFNSLSFFSAIATVISGARSVLPTPTKLFIKQEVENLQRNLLKTSILLGCSMLFVLLAFATAGVVVLPPLMKFRSNIFSTIGIGGSVCFMFLFSFGKHIYKLGFDIQSSQRNKIGFFERWGFKTWHIPNPFTRSRGSID